MIEMRRKQIVLLLLSLVLALVLAACGKKEKAEVDVENEAEKVNTSDFPIVDDTLEMNFVAPSGSSTDWNDILVFNEYEEMTNIDIEWDNITKDGLKEKTNVMLNTDEYPDAFHSVGFTAQEIAKYGEQGIFVPIEDLLDEYAPNLTELMDEYPSMRSALTMPDGHIYSFPRIYDPEFKSVLSGWKLWVNKDFLDTLGMDEPTTLDEYYDYLVAVKENNPTGNGENNEVPLQVSKDENLIKIFAGAFGLMNRGEMNTYFDADPEDDEKVRFFPTTDRYKELLQYLNKLYEEELLNKDLYTVKSEEVRARGADGLFGSVIITDPTQYDEGEYIGLGALEGPHGDKVYGNVKDAIVAPGGFVITDNNPNPAAAVRWVDYFYSDEGVKLFFMGKEGLTYEEADDGSVEYTDEINENPEGLSYTDAISKYMTWRDGTYPSIVKEKYFKGSEGLETSTEAAEKFQDGIPDEIWPKFNFDKDESEIISSTGLDIEDYVEEQNALFITGELPFDKWDDYVETLEGMGLDEHIEIHQDAYERYLEAQEEN